MLRSALTAALLVVGLQAQQTYVVDRAGGGDFTNLAAAFATAVPGDRVEVRRGTYDPAPIQVGIEVVADPDVRLTPGTILWIEGIAAGQHATVKGFRNPRRGFTGEGYAVVVRNNAGGVHLEDLESTFTGASSALVMAIENSRAVSMLRCRLAGGPALAVNGSTVSCHDSTLTGQWHFAACSVDGTIDFAACKLYGGSSSLSPKPALEVWTGAARATAATSFFGGSSTLAPVDFPDVFVGQGSLTIDPSTDAALIEGPFTVAEVPALALRSVSASPTLVLDVQPSPVAFAAVVIDLPRAPVPSPFGELWVDPATAASLHFGPVPAGGVRRAVPSWARDQSVAVQALILTGSGAAAISPVLVVHLE